VRCKISGSFILHGPLPASYVSEWVLPLPLLSERIMGDGGALVTRRRCSRVVLEVVVSIRGGDCGEDDEEGVTFPLE
jgi:hypothetical protein